MANCDNSINFYHGAISREDAEAIIKENGEEGSFLVRDSSTSPGDYGLSVLRGDEVIHFQVRRHENDAFYSIETSVICHGLENLIEYYQGSNIDKNLVVELKKPILKDPPPPETKRHGRNNLLHRATKEGDVKIVEEWLKYNYRNFDAKNEQGQTAVHLACMINHSIILRKLIEAKTNVNCRDKDGNTPLHYVCQLNFPDLIEILVEGAGAQIQARKAKTNWVPLHEAASRGFIECIKALLSLNAPHRPRTNNNDIPADLASRNGHYECAQFLLDYKSPPPRTKRQDWYHGTLKREDAMKILMGMAGTPDGMFLVRYSPQHGSYTLSMLCSEKLYHFKISHGNNFYYIDDGPYMDSLETLIEHYMNFMDGLPCKLQSPVTPEPSPPLPTSPHPKLFSTLPRRSNNISSNGRNARNFTNQFSSLRISHNSSPISPTLPEIKNHSPARIRLGSPVENSKTGEQCKSSEYIPRDNIILQDCIGEGEYGSVYKAILQDKLGNEKSVAVKTLRIELEETNREQFLSEAHVMMKLNHECIVSFIGICIEQTVLMVQELVPLGSMLSYLISHRETISPIYELKLWASQIARGMHYLEQQRFVHRDLAARNILLASKFQAKISDFGLSRSLSSNKEYYKASVGGRWPIKWYAPESYNYGNFSSASDVWSFGITLWEMYTYGEQPYGSAKGATVIEMVDRGERLAKPHGCPSEIFFIMEECWNLNPQNRPTFSELTMKFRCPEYTNDNDIDRCLGCRRRLF